MDSDARSPELTLLDVVRVVRSVATTDREAVATVLSLLRRGLVVRHESRANVEA